MAIAIGVAVSLRRGVVSFRDHSSLCNWPGKQLVVRSAGTTHLASLPWVFFVVDVARGLSRATQD
jgi:hypothetical protein